MESPQRPNKVRPTRRLTPTERRRVEPPPPKEKNPWLLPLYISGGVILLLIIIAAATCGGDPDKPRTEKTKKTKTKPKPPLPPKRPDVSHLEAQAKIKCEEGLRLLQPWLKPASGASKEEIRRGLEVGLKPLKEGLDIYAEASQKGGKSYSLDEFASARREGLILFCPDVESEGRRKCDEGLSIIKSSESLMENSMIDEAQKRTLREELLRGKKLIEEGLNLLERSHLVSGHRFDTTAYGQARKAASMKILELKE